MAYSGKTGVLARFREMQEKNGRRSLQYWKPRISPNQQGQRELIARAMGNKFVKINLMSQLEIRISNGELGRPVSAPAGIATDAFDKDASEFPPLSSDTNMLGSQDLEYGTKEGSSRKMSRSMKGSAKRVSISNKSPDTERQDTLSKWQNRDREEKRDHEILYRDDSTRPVSASHKRREFKRMLTTSSRFVEDGLLTKCLSHQIDMEARDPKSVYLALQKALSSSVEFTLCSDAYNTRQALEMRDKAKNEAKTLGMAIILDPSVVTSGLKVTLKIRYRYDPRYDRTHTASNVFAPAKPKARGTMFRTASFSGTRGSISAKSRKGSVKFVSAKGRGGDLGSSQNVGGDVMEVDYALNASRKYRYDMKLKLDNRIESSPLVNGEPMFLPGWEGIMPLFIPANHVVCQVLVTRDNNFHGDAEEMLDVMKESASEMPEISTRGRRTSAPAPSHAFDLGIKIPGLAFSCESPITALRMLRKISSDAMKSKTANLMVPGNLPALHVAALHGNIDAMRELMQNGADANLMSPPPMYTTALHEAVMGGQVEAIKFLLDMRANDREVDYDGNAPLHLAVIQDDIECMMPLLKSSGAAKVLTTKNRKGRTPYDLAKATSTRLCVERGMKALHMVVKKRERIV